MEVTKWLKPSNSGHECCPGGIAEGRFIGQHLFEAG